MNDPLIITKNLGFRDGRNIILADIDLAIGHSEIVTIVGPNGSGKTTLLRLLIGAIEPNVGAVTRDPELQIGYMPQRLSIDRTLPLTIERFLSLGGTASRPDRACALASVHLPSREKAQMIDLSGGELQRVLLARALLRRPNLLVLDEPTQGLDQPGEAAFYQLIEKVRDETACAILMVSHDLHVVMSASDRVVCLNGHICCQGTPTLVRDHPEYQKLFGLGTGGALALYRHEHDHHHHDSRQAPSEPSGRRPPQEVVPP